MHPWHVAMNMYTYKIKPVNTASYFNSEVIFFSTTTSTPQAYSRRGNCEALSMFSHCTCLGLNWKQMAHPNELIWKGINESFTDG